ncbi:peptidase [Fluviicola chungangensis]|uniref:Peptidase n=1 Tax=Fluviicola chungangensis TaxID=2597671 RepID=A0A556N2Z4_9FLAO|nr:peptidase [Fluviicola chungangensis]TSJ46443.1 peptidase [Fluviicola chungangensis]
MRVLKLAFLLFLLFAPYSCKKDSDRRINKFHRQEVGKSAHDILSDKDYRSITIEIMYMTGFKPTDQAINNLKELIAGVCNKPDGIKMVLKEIPAQGKSTYSISDVKIIEDQNRKEFTYKKDLATCFIFLDGASGEDQGSSMVLGQAYFNTSMVIYEKSLKDHSGGLGEPELYKLESTVINHEFGHILGLVNLGSAMYNSHQDTAHGAHCDNSDCLMYWEVETGSIFDNLIGSVPIPTFDQNCLKDLLENGGK